MPNLPHVVAGDVITANAWNAVVDDLNPFTQALKVVSVGGGAPPPPGQGGDLLIRGVNNWQNNGDQSILYLGDSDYLIKAKKGEGLTLGAKFAVNGLVISEGGDTRIGGANPARAKLEIDGGDGWVVNAWRKSLLLTASDPSVTFNNPASPTKFGIGLKSAGGMDRLHIFSTDADLGLNTGAFSNRLVIQEDGKVGIGVDAPSQKLEVAGDVLVKGIAGFDAPDEEAKLFLGNTDHFIKSVRGGGTAAAGVTIGTWSVPNALVIREQTGNIGIGTTDPKTPLHLKGNAGILNVEGTDHAFIQFFPNSFNSGRKAWLGYGSAGASTLTLRNEFLHGSIEISTDFGILLNTGSGIRVNNTYPIQFKRFKNLQINILSINNGYDTGFSASLYNAGIMGFKHDSSVTVTAPITYMEVKNGTWWIYGSPIVGNGQVDVLFVRVELSSLTGY